MSVEVLIPIFYRPEASVAADFIPFYWQGEYHLFYLRDYRDEAGHGPGTPWWHLVTRDFVHFEDWGEALPRGPRAAQDLWVFTGSVIEHAGVFHIFYTGHNSYFAKDDRPMQAVMHATSPDLRTWTKDAGFQFFAPPELGYEKHDWRDPFVYWDERFQAFGMLLAARRASGPSRNRGCVAFATSPDLKQWTVREPFWAPDEYYTHECPDLFCIGDWWYLVYSTFSERCVTHYRMSRSLAGPWLAPANDAFDGRAYYAAKTAGDGRRRFVFGWLPTREKEKDDGGWQWGGELVVHEITQRPDGTLSVRCPDRVLAEFAKPVAVAPKALLGTWDSKLGTCAANAVGRVSILDLGAMPDECLIETAVAFAPGTAGCGLLLRADAAADRYYQLRFEPDNARLVIDRWPRPGDQPFMLERPLTVKAGEPLRLRVLVAGTNLVAYANDTVALSCRLYEHRTGNLGLFVTEGAATFAGTVLRTRK